MTTSKSKPSFAGFLVTVFMLIHATFGLAQQLVTNGDFENDTFNGWTQTGNLTDTLISSAAPYVHSGSFGAQLGPGGSLGFLSQNLATVPGEIYVLSFWLNSSDSRTPNEFQASWNGTVIFDQTDISAVGWTNILLTNTAASASTALQFGFDNTPAYFGLDDITVTPVNVPMPTVTPPANDNFASPLTVTAPFYQFAANNSSATRQANEPDHGSPVDQPTGGGADPGGTGNASVWWSFTAPSAGYVDITISSNTFTPLIAVYTGTTLSSNLPVVVKSSEEWGVPPSNLEDILANNVHFSVTSGTNYRIAVDGYAQGKGAFTFTSRFTALPANDNFASRITLPAAFTSVNGSNGAASLETGEPFHSSTTGAAQGSVWWSWTPNAAGTVFLTTAGSAFDTVLDVYTGTALTGLTHVASNDNAFAFTNTVGPTFDPQSRLSLATKTATTYQICVSAANGESGAVVLNNVAIALDAIVSSLGTSNADNTLSFNTVLDVNNLGSTASGLLRVTLWTKPGYAYQAHLLTDYQLIASLNVPEQQIGQTNLPGAGVLPAHNAVHVNVSGICPAPFYYTNIPSVGSPQVIGIGYSVVATLEEAVGSNWVALDSRSIIVGNWPIINDFIGPNGGVLTLNSGMANSPATSSVVTVNFGPPAAKRLGGFWRISPNNDGANGELRFYTNYINTTNFTLLVTSTNFSADLLPLTGFTVSTNRLVTYPAGSAPQVGLFYAVNPPKLVYNAKKGLGITGTPSTAYRIETTTNPTNDVTWAAVTSNTLASGTNFVPNTAISTKGNQFFRAVWLTN